MEEAPNFMPNYFYPFSIFWGFSPKLAPTIVDRTKPPSNGIFPPPREVVWGKGLRRIIRWRNPPRPQSFFGKCPFWELSEIQSEFFRWHPPRRGNGWIFRWIDDWAPFWAPRLMACEWMFVYLVFRPPVPFPSVIWVVFSLALSELAVLIFEIFFALLLLRVFLILLCKKIRVSRIHSVVFFVVFFSPPSLLAFIVKKSSSEEPHREEACGGLRHTFPRRFVHAPFGTVACA